MSKWSKHKGKKDNKENSAGASWIGRSSPTQRIIQRFFMSGGLQVWLEVEKNILMEKIKLIWRDWENFIWEQLCQLMVQNFDEKFWSTDWHGKIIG